MYVNKTVLERDDAYVRQRMDEEGIPSLVIALTDCERVLFSRAYGYADVPARIPATTSTLYETGSIGKSFTAVALLQLQEEGRVDLQGPVTEYLPWFQVQSAFEPIRLHDLLSHTSGLIGGTDYTPSQRMEVWSLRDTETGSPPGTYFHYSNVGYKTLGLVLETITGQPYAEIIRERILEPLGILESSAAIVHETRLRMAQPYTRHYDDRPWHPDHPLVPGTWLETDTGDGGIN